MLESMPGGATWKIVIFLKLYFFWKNQTRKTLYGGAELRGTTAVLRCERDFVPFYRRLLNENFTKTRTFRPLIFFHYYYNYTFSESDFISAASKGGDTNNVKLTQKPAGNAVAGG